MSNGGGVLNKTKIIFLALILGSSISLAQELKVENSIPEKILIGIGIGAFDSDTKLNGKSYDTETDIHLIIGAQSKISNNIGVRAYFNYEKNVVSNKNTNSSTTKTKLGNYQIISSNFDWIKFSPLFESNSNFNLIYFAGFSIGFIKYKANLISAITSLQNITPAENKDIWGFYSAAQLGAGLNYKNHSLEHVIKIPFFENKIEWQYKDNPTTIAKTKLKPQWSWIIRYTYSF